MAMESKLPSQISGPKVGFSGLSGVGYGSSCGVWGLTGGRGGLPVFGPAEHKDNKTFNIYKRQMCPVEDGFHYR